MGKGTVVAEVRRLFPHVWVSISCTTRKPRPGEVDGVQYHFLTDAQFDELIATDRLLEYATFAGNRYGTPRRPVEQHLAAGRPTLLEIELQGARQVRQRMPEAQFVFLAPPSESELRDRLTGRGTETDDMIEARLTRARVRAAGPRRVRRGGDQRRRRAGRRRSGVAAQRRRSPEPARPSERSAAQSTCLVAATSAASPFLASLNSMLVLGSP